MNAQPTAGAMRAAEHLSEYEYSIEETARIIDFETGTTELVAALEALYKNMPCQQCASPCPECLNALAVLAKHASVETKA